MRSYRNATQDLIEGFEECSFELIPKVQKCLADSLDTLALTFNGPAHPIGKYEIEARHMPFILNNVKSWKVFEYEKQINQFFNLTGDFKGEAFDEENEFQEEFFPTQEPFQRQMEDTEEAIWEMNSIAENDTK